MTVSTSQMYALSTQHCSTETGGNGNKTVKAKDTFHTTLFYGNSKRLEG